MTFTVRWTRRALRRLDEIGEYIAKENPTAARRTISLIATRVISLGDHPALGRLGRLSGTRELVVDARFVVAYRVHNSDVEILTILHGAQQWPDRL